MKKTIIALSLICVICFCGCAPTSITPPPVTDEISLWTQDNTTKVLRDTAPLGDKILRATAAKGEHEGAQLIVQSKKDISKVEIEAADLVCGTSTISKENIDIYRQHYFDLQVTYDEKQKKGWYPDALVPFNASAVAGENKITKDQNFGIWFTFRIPDIAASGLYKAAFKLSLDGKDYLISVEVEVYDFALPKENHVKTAFAIWIDDMCNIWGNSNPDIHKVQNNAEVLSLLNSYTDMLSNYRVSPTALPLLWGDLENSLKVVEAAIAATENDKIASYSIPVKEIETSNGISKTKLKEIMTALIKASSNQLNLLKKAYFYIPKIDEPLFQNLIPLAKKVNEIVEEVRNELLSDSTLWQGKEDVKISLQTLQHVLTADYDSRLFGITQTWCPYFSDFHTEEERELYYSRRDTYGEGLWWYGCVGPKYPQPTFHMNNNIASARTIGWMQNIYKIDGQLYWTVNLSRQMKSDNLYHVRDIWNDAYSFYNVAGDGYLVYPGEKYGIDNALPSIRLEAIRDGFEDYEYLYLLEELLAPLEKTYELSDLTLANYVKHLSAKLFSGTIPTETDSNLSLAKNQLASLIILAQNDVLIRSDGDKLQIFAPNTVTEVIANDLVLKEKLQGNFKVFELEKKALNTLQIKINNQTISAEYTK